MIRVTQHKRMEAELRSRPSGYPSNSPYIPYSVAGVGPASLLPTVWATCAQIQQEPCSRQLCPEAGSGGPQHTGITRTGQRLCSTGLQTALAGDLRPLLLLLFELRVISLKGWIYLGFTHFWRTSFAHLVLLALCIIITLSVLLSQLV